jgi:hypothetical protein
MRGLFAGGAVTTAEFLSDLEEALASRLADVRIVENDRQERRLVAAAARILARAAEEELVNCVASEDRVGEAIQ